MNVRMACAALAISNKVASSRPINHLTLRKYYRSRAQDFLATYPVFTSFNSASRHQVNIPLKKGLKFLLHSNVVEQTPLYVVIKSHNKINIAL